LGEGKSGEIIFSQSSTSVKTMEYRYEKLVGMKSLTGTKRNCAPHPMKQKAISYYGLQSIKRIE